MAQIARAHDRYVLLVRTSADTGLLMIEDASATILQLKSERTRCSRTLLISAVFGLACQPLLSYIACLERSKQHKQLACADEITRRHQQQFPEYGFVTCRCLYAQDAADHGSGWFALAPSFLLGGKPP